VEHGAGVIGDEQLPLAVELALPLGLLILEHGPLPARFGVGPGFGLLFGRGSVRALEEPIPASACFS
jgi:hypothetical protein